MGRTEAEAECPVFWPPNAKSQLTGKDPDAVEDRRQEEKGMAEYKMIGWHLQPGLLEGSGAETESRWGPGRSGGFSLDPGGSGRERGELPCRPPAACRTVLGWTLGLHLISSALSDAQGPE